MEEHKEAWKIYREERLKILRDLVKAHESSSISLINKLTQSLADLENDPGMYFETKK